MVGIRLPKGAGGGGGDGASEGDDEVDVTDDVVYPDDPYPDVSLS